METPIADFVRRYADSGMVRAHMPGHKGQSLLGFEPWDITEIKGADELYGADGIIAQSEANATRLFGTVHTYYSTEGSSQCIRAMLCLALQAAPAAGQRPVLLGTSARDNGVMTPQAVRDLLVDRPVLLLFGTGHGMAPEILDACDGILRPLRWMDAYNHLPVRGAVAITLDRVLGDCC